MGRKEPRELIKAYDDHDHRRSEMNEEMAEEAKKKVVKAWGKLLPFGAQVVASAAAYTVGVTATQLVGFVCKVSCATPVLGPCMGIVGVGFASALAGQASKHTHKMISTGANPFRAGFWEPLDVDDMVFDALLGIFVFKAMGGRFSSLMPSDLSKPGALAFESIPVRADNSEAYAQPSVKRELARIFRRDGCHHCGSYRGPVIGDHMPPNKMMPISKAAKDKLPAAVDNLPGISKVRELIGLSGRTGKPLQRFYPQCQRCSIKQATAMRSGKRVLVLHLHAPRYRSEHLAGIFVGIRHNVPPVSFADAPRGRSGSNKLPLALLAAAPVLDAADEAAAAAEAGRRGNAAVPQLLVQELSAAPSWELQAYVPGAAAGAGAGAPPVHGGGSSNAGYARGSSGSHLQQQQQQYSSGGKWGSGGGYKQERRGAGSSSSSSGGGMPPQSLPGSLGLVQQQLADVLQPQDCVRDSGGSLKLSLEGWMPPGGAGTGKDTPRQRSGAAAAATVAEAAKQRADAAFERFAGGLAR
ncbi:hypothetical protein OEZ85_013990 [Tetradesmus obliquus]|uniref:Uncharacterized protein n=1 Tax=Tetradesmus obliquus TaxID=3088 RepID=A0ABY8U9F5_TETOB|nr:hypothetical protein OEZ85_013990 [Tetradesmus obliquus]